MASVMEFMIMLWFRPVKYAVPWSCVTDKCYNCKSKSHIASDNLVMEIIQMKMNKLKIWQTAKFEI